MPQHIYRSQKANFVCFCPSKQVVSLELLRSSGLVANTFIHWAILPAPLPCPQVLKIFLCQSLQSHYILTHLSPHLPLFLETGPSLRISNSRPSGQRQQVGQLEDSSVEDVKWYVLRDALRLWIWCALQTIWMHRQEPISSVLGAKSLHIKPNLCSAIIK